MAPWRNMKRCKPGQWCTLAVCLSVSESCSVHVSQFENPSANLLAYPWGVTPQDSTSCSIPQTLFMNVDTFFLEK